MTDKPHDTLFRATFSQVRHAAAELRCVLPETLACRIEWSSLTLEQGTFVSERLRGQLTDLLYSAKLQSGGDAFLYLLFEHQSSVQPHMALRLLDYMVAIWKRFETEHGANCPLPAVVPIVLHHGARGWNAAVEFQDLFELSRSDLEAIGPFVPSFRFALDDLAGQSSEALRARAMEALPRLVLWCLARARQEGFVAELREWAQLFEEMTGEGSGTRAIAQVIRYITLVADVDPAQIGKALAEGASPQAEEAFMTVAERLVQEGMEKGRIQAQREVLLKLLQLRFGAVPFSDQERIEAGGAAELDRWTTRVVHATSLDEVLGV